MLISESTLKKRYKDLRPSLEHILSVQQSSPEEYKQNTDHLSHMRTLFPYVYYTGIVTDVLPDQKAHILDWGAFLGQVAYLLQDRYDVTAYNPVSIKQIDYWHEQLHIAHSVVESDMKSRQIHLPSESFDAVISSGVLEHTFEYGMDDVSALRNLWQLLKPGGFLFIWNLPRQGSLAESLAQVRKKWRHILTYTQEDVLVKLNLTGFDIIKMEQTELLFNKFARFVNPEMYPTVWQADHTLGRVPGLRHLTQHFTIIAQKVDGFPQKPAHSGYDVYV